jgi:ubiquinone/menaquinone biosynthesis C-methylase UbiE
MDKPPPSNEMAFRTRYQIFQTGEHTLGPPTGLKLQPHREAIMNTNPSAANPPTIDLNVIKGRQHVAWGSGNYAAVGSTLQIVGETLCEALDLRSNQRVLDVAAGNGNATLAAARRFADVTSTDYVGALLENGCRRAEVEQLQVTFQKADAEQLPFADESFDVVLSTFGVMFTPNQEQAAGELMRVCRPGGRIGLSNWTPDGFIGRLFKIIGKYVPPSPGTRSPLLWGTPAHLEKLFGSNATLATERTNFVFRYRSAQHWVEFFRTYYGPVLKAFAAIEPEARVKLEADIHQLLRELNVAEDGTLVIPGEYLQAIITKKR